MNTRSCNTLIVSCRDNKNNLCFIRGKRKLSFFAQSPHNVLRITFNNRCIPLREVSFIEANGAVIGVLLFPVKSILRVRWNNRCTIRSFRYYPGVRWLLCEIQESFHLHVKRWEIFSRDNLYMITSRRFPLISTLRSFAAWLSSQTWSKTPR